MIRFIILLACALTVLTVSKASAERYHAGPVLQPQAQIDSTPDGLPAPPEGYHWVPVDSNPPLWHEIPRGQEIHSV